MAETIQEFVTQLQAEGVEAGRKEAEKIRDEARQEADRIVADARAEADKIVANAKAEGQNLLSRGRTELQLAARDTILRLRETLCGVLRGVIEAGTREKLSDAGYLGETLREVIVAYAHSFGQAGRIEVNVPESLKDRLAGETLARLSEAAGDGNHIDLKGTLKEAGFEYSLDGATVDVTLQSVVDTLSQLVSPKLRELLAGAVDEIKQQKEQ